MTFWNSSCIENVQGAIHAPLSFVVAQFIAPLTFNLNDDFSLAKNAFVLAQFIAPRTFSDKWHPNWSHRSPRAVWACDVLTCYTPHAHRLATFAMECLSSIMQWHKFFSRDMWCMHSAMRSPLRWAFNCSFDRNIYFKTFQHTSRYPWGICLFYLTYILCVL